MSKFPKLLNALLLVLFLLLSLNRMALAADLVIGTRTEPASLDPHYLWNPINNQLSYHYLGFMARTGPDGKLIPSIGLKWEAVGNNEWRFTMDSKAKFSNGDPVTVSDAIASYERAMDLPNSTYTGLFAHVERFEDGGNNVLKIVTKTPDPMMPYALSQVAIIPKSIADKATSKDFSTPEFNVSAGPYVFSKYVPGDRLELTANPGYFGPKAKWDHVTFRFLSDQAARVAALLSGSVDMIDGVLPDDASEISKRSDFKVVQASTERTVYMTFDLSRDVTPQVKALDGSPLSNNPFKDKRVRRAFAYAINRDAIVARVLAGQGEPMNQIGSPKLSGFNPGIATVPFDMAQSKKLLAEAGYPNGFALTVTCFSGRLVNDARICQAIGQMLERIGLKVTVDVQPYQVLLSKVICHCDDRPSFFMSTWSSAYAGEVGAALQNVVHSYSKAEGRATWNLGEYSNPQVDRLIDQAMGTMDNAARFKLEGEAMKLAMDDYFILPLHLQGVALAAKKGLTPTPFTNEYTMADYVSVDR